MLLFVFSSLYIFHRFENISYCNESFIIVRKRKLWKKVTFRNFVNRKSDIEILSYCLVYSLEFFCMPQLPLYAKFISENNILETCEMTFQGISLCMISPIQLFAYMYVILLIIKYSIKNILELKNVLHKLKRTF